MKTRSGHCEYFATATVLLLRKLHIPARYAVGFAVHEASGSGYVVRERDAHAWCLVWNESRKTWQDFDTTPASWVESENRHASPTQWLSDAWSRAMFEFSKIRWGQTHLRQYILWSLIPVLALLLYRILFRSRRSRQKLDSNSTATAIAWPGLDSEFYQIERKLSERGHARIASEPASAWLRRGLDDPGLKQCEMSLQNLLRLHYRYRFDPSGLSETDRQALRAAARVCLAELDRFKPAPVRC